ncbi:hypothetical protein [Alkalibacterium olivapovliticus]|uniref:Uncharacterized protein n=1 Tax=Alkalibacterium olivapovliticus TaxID=99907 RepID=A0A2T0W2H0_9LACT|nr:hypothetical protein [Alkalibacterium olivapovliticus]PRY79346.1 hypothetical protein CLV38_12328 [Alkalibacterium olivapovliticus]
MEEYIDSEYEELEAYAKSLDMTPEEYALSLHKKNQKVKSVLLVNGHEYKQFVEEFHSVLDDMVAYKTVNAKKQSVDDQLLIKKVVHILTSTSADPKVLAQLFHHYPEGINDKLNNLSSR